MDKSPTERSAALEDLATLLIQADNESSVIRFACKKFFDQKFSTLSTAFNPPLTLAEIAKRARDIQELKNTQEISERRRKDEIRENENEAFPQMTTQKLRAFFASPYAADYLWIRDAIAAACREMDVDFRSVDETVIPGASIIDSITLEIAASDLGIAVISNFNPNVMYELGLLLGSSKPTILITDKESIARLPFDLRSFSMVSYDSNTKNREDLINVVSKSLAKVKASRSTAFMNSVATSRALPENFSTLTSTASATEVQFLSSIDWGNVKSEAERMLGKSGCKTIEVVVNENSDVQGWKQILDCPCGDRVIVIVDINGRITRAKVQ